MKISTWKRVAVMALTFPLLSLAPHAEAAPTYRIMALGDSITVGIGSVGANGRTDFNGWRNKLLVGGVKYLHPDYVGTCPQSNPAWKCVGTPTMSDKAHAGSSGWRTDEILARTPWYMDTFKPRAVLLMAGANDVGQSRVEGYADRMAAIIDVIRTKSPTTHVFVATMTMQARSRDTIASMNRSLVSTVERMDKRYVHLVPMHIIGGPRDLYDGVHPNNCGYSRMAYVWYQYMAKVYAPRGWPRIANPFYSHVGGC